MNLNLTYNSTKNNEHPLIIGIKYYLNSIYIKWNKTTHQKLVTLLEDVILFTFSEIIHLPYLNNKAPTKCNTASDFTQWRNHKEIAVRTHKTCIICMQTNNITFIF